MEREVAFVLEADRLKTVLRQSLLTDGSRRENSAEHSWHVALMAIVLAEHHPGPLDVGRVLRMLVVHDLVEIDAGDTYVYDAEGARTKAEREEAAAQRLFGLLPDDLRDLVRAVWDEFELRRTPEARFASALDRLQPLLHNFVTGGRSWREHGVRAEQVLERNREIADAAPSLWAWAQRLVSVAAARGDLGEGGGTP